LRTVVCFEHDVVDVYAPKGIQFPPVCINTRADAKNINRLVFFSTHA
jgi:hypothetical protein